MEIDENRQVTVDKSNWLVLKVDAKEIIDLDCDDTVECDGTTPSLESCT